MLTRAITILTATAGLTVLLVEPCAGNGWGTASCNQIPTPDCDLSAGITGGSGPPATGDPHNEEKGGSGVPHGDTVPEGQPAAYCSYAPSDYRPPPTGVITAAYTPRPHTMRAHPARFRRNVQQPVGNPTEQAGTWYVWKCTRTGAPDAVYALAHPPVWVPSGQGAVPPEEAAELARRQLRLPAPEIAANPVGDQLVNLPTWLWVSRWEPQSATASVPGVSVTAVATPTSATWSMGDGALVECNGPGTPFPFGANPASASPTCGHTYRHSSADQPGQAFPVSVTVRWKVHWSGAGREGELPELMTTARASFRVAESHALNIGG
jgi:hypothetical protein